jgi:hypothetical protein
MTKKGVMNTLQQHDMPPNMDEGCQHHPLRDQFPVVSSNAVLAFGTIAAHIAGCLVVPSLEAGNSERFQPTYSHPHLSLLLHSLHLVLFLMQGSISSLLVGQHPEVLSQTPINNSRFTWQSTLCHGSQKNCHYCQAKRKSTQVISSRFVLQLGNMKRKKNRETGSKYLPTLQIK